MIKIILKNKKIGLAIFIIYAILVTFLSLYSFKSSNNNIKIPNFDKFIHFCFYLGMTLCFYNYLRLNTSKKISYLLLFTVIFTITFSVIIEFIQPYFGRSKDVYDMLANTCGTLFGLIIILCLKKYKKIKYKP